MLQYIVNKIGYGLFVMLGVVMLVFFLFQGIGDPTRLIVGQRADAATQQSIRRELNLEDHRRLVDEAIAELRPAGHQRQRELASVKS